MDRPCVLFSWGFLFSFLLYETSLSFFPSGIFSLSAWFFLSNERKRHAEAPTSKIFATVQSKLTTRALYSRCPETQRVGHVEMRTRVKRKLVLSKGKKNAKEEILCNFLVYKFPTYWTAICMLHATQRNVMYSSFPGAL